MQKFRDCYLFFSVVFVDLLLPYLEILWYLCLQIHNGGLDLGLEVVLLDLLSVQLGVVLRYLPMQLGVVLRCLPMQFGVVLRKQIITFLNNLKTTNVKHPVL